MQNGRFGGRSHSQCGAVFRPSYDPLSLLLCQGYLHCHGGPAAEGTAETENISAHRRVSYVWLMARRKRYEDCFVNVHAVEHRIEGLSDDAQLRLLPELERCNWQIDRVFLKGLTTLFTKPILCYDTSRNTFSALRGENVVFALRQGGEMDEYEISADGAQWLSYNEAKTDSGAALLNRANRIICGYSMMMLV